VEEVRCHTSRFHFRLAERTAPIASLSLTPPPSFSLVLCLGFTSGAEFQKSASSLTLSEPFLLFRFRFLLLFFVLPPPSSRSPSSSFFTHPPLGIRSNRKWRLWPTRDDADIHKSQVCGTSAAQLWSQATSGVRLADRVDTQAVCVEEQRRANCSSLVLSVNFSTFCASSRLDQPRLTSSPARSRTHQCSPNRAGACNSSVIFSGAFSFFFFLLQRPSDQCLGVGGVRVLFDN
jgi:hypothetical protein